MQTISKQYHNNNNIVGYYCCVYTDLNILSIYVKYVNTDTFLKTL